MTMTRSTLNTVHIAVLECEEFPPNIVQSHGNFTNIFADWLASGTRKLNSERPENEHVHIETSTWSPKQGNYPTNIDCVDGLIITGSVLSAYDDIPWIKELGRYISDIYVTKPHIKIFGSCFGHQLIAQSLLSQHGVRVEKALQGWEIGVHEVQHATAFMENFPELLGQRVQYQFLHSDEVVAPELPVDWIAMGSSKLCEVQGLFRPGRVLTFQGHPEFDGEILRDFVTRLLRGGGLDLVTYELSLRMLDREHSGSRVLAAQVLVDFLTRK